MEVARRCASSSDSDSQVLDDHSAGASARPDAARPAVIAVVEGECSVTSGERNGGPASTLLTFRVPAGAACVGRMIDQCSGYAEKNSASRSASGCSRFCFEIST